MDPRHNLSMPWSSYPTEMNPASAWTNMSTGVKRPHSESDDCDDVFSEESSKDQCTSPGDTESCQMLSRKKRRGVIEKKRRDRINTSLTELKRLVPSAYEKQGSTKLEKAEILQMTVDHLKMIHAKGLDVLAYDPHKFAMDYHNIGFRECASEVARYLVTIEGMDIQDPLRLRLMSHLQCFAAQRELAAKQSTSTSWGYTPPPPSQHYPPLNPHIPPSPNHHVGGNLGNIPSPHHGPPPPPPPLAPPLHHQTNTNQDLSNHYDISTSCAQPTIIPTSPESQTKHSSTTSTSVLTPLTTTTSMALGYSHQQYTNLNSFTPLGVNTSLPHLQNYNQSNTTVNMKPYRPWGAEVAY